METIPSVPVSTKDILLGETWGSHRDIQRLALNGVTGGQTHANRVSILTMWKEWYTKKKVGAWEKMSPSEKEWFLFTEAGKNIRHGWRTKSLETNTGQ